jgi:hypothetical protein
MNEQDAKAICEKHGSSFLSYTLGRAAYIVLPSNEHVIISIGTLTAKVLTKRRILGWWFPKVITSQSIAIWQPTFDKLDRLRRFACGAMVLDGLLSLVSKCKSLDELRLVWPVIRNPLDVSAADMIEREFNLQPHSE